MCYGHLKNKQITLAMILMGKHLTAEIIECRFKARLIEVEQAKWPIPFISRAWEDLKNKIEDGLYLVVIEYWGNEIKLNSYLMNRIWMEMSISYLNYENERLQFNIGHP